MKLSGILSEARLVKLNEQNYFLVKLSVGPMQVIEFPVSPKFLGSLSLGEEIEFEFKCYPTDAEEFELEKAQERPRTNKVELTDDDVRAMYGIDDREVGEVVLAPKIAVQPDSVTPADLDSNNTTINVSEKEYMTKKSAAKSKPTKNIVNEGDEHKSVTETNGKFEFPDMSKRELESTADDMEVDNDQEEKINLNAIF